MIELLALPAWDTPPTLLSAWAERLEGQGLTVSVTRESTGVSWVEVGSLRLRGYAVMEGLHAEAINFELAAPDPAPARAALERAAAELAWELHEEDEGGGEGDEDDD